MRLDEITRGMTPMRWLTVAALTSAMCVALVG